MGSGKSVYLAAAIVDQVLGGASFTPPATVYIALSTAAFDTNATISSEASGGSYARVAVTNNLTNWPSANPKTNAGVITFPAATASWGSIVSFRIMDAASGGNVLYGGDLSVARTVSSGDTASFAIGALSIAEA